MRGVDFEKAYANKKGSLEEQTLRGAMVLSSSTPEARRNRLWIGIAGCEPFTSGRG
jgi:hypothetical protein